MAYPEQMREQQPPFPSFTLVLSQAQSTPPFYLVFPWTPYTYPHNSTALNANMIPVTTTPQTPPQTSNAPFRAILVRFSSLRPALSKTDRRLLDNAALLLDEAPCALRNLKSNPCHIRTRKLELNSGLLRVRYRTIRVVNIFGDPPLHTVHTETRQRDVDAGLSLHACCIFDSFGRRVPTFSKIQLYNITSESNGRTGKIGGGREKKCPFSLFVVSYPGVSVCRQAKSNRSLVQFLG
ncbi:hypothetical protein B0H10DRAFT_465927 [Mycena sp. CBHHK59/15]|nr:hypothetical protein B0H10DRAFT_465927 [Mycena sp. CBHHK59/15]